MKVAYSGAWLVVALLLGGCASTSEKPPEPTELIDIDSPVAEADDAWSRGAGAGFASEPAGFRAAVGDNLVVTADEKGQVFAFALDSGKQLWKQDLDRPVVSGPAIVENLAILGTREGQVIAVSLEDGSERWEARVSGEVLAPAVGGEGVVVVRSFDGFVYGLKAEGGQRLWAVDRTVPTLTLRGISAPILEQGKVILGTDGGNVLAIGLHDGVPEWEATVSIPTGRSELERLVDVDASPLTDGVDVYAASYAGDLVAMDIGTGEVRWSQKVASLRGMAYEGDRLFVTDPECRIVAVDRNSGAKLWTSEALRYRDCTGPVIHRGLVVVGDLEGYLHWLGPEDGKVLLRDRPVRDPMAPPVVVDGRLLALSEEGKLVAIDLLKP